jgi:hypothetical protein
LIGINKRRIKMDRIVKLELEEEIELLEKKVALLKQMVELQGMIAEYDKRDKTPKYVPIPYPGCPYPDPWRPWREPFYTFKTTDHTTLTTGRRQ